MRSFFAPGRVNIIGEHIDYNGGFVLPAAISLGIKLDFDETADGFVHLKSDTQEIRSGFPITQVLSSRKDYYGWTNFPRGVINELSKRQVPIQSGNLSFKSDLPIASGLSSSACIEVLTAYAFFKMTDIEPGRKDLALLAQKVENEFIGVNCGIMDQCIIANGKKDHALLLNCATLEVEYIPVQINNYTWVIMNTSKPRSLIKSKYNERRIECNVALSSLKKAIPEKNSLCDYTLEEITDVLDSKRVYFKRAKHAVTEQNRVLETVGELKNGNAQRVGHLLSLSHNSLRDDYEVTGKELNAIVEAAMNTGVCVGARMTGAGFGGCALALVETDKLDFFKENVYDEYTQKISFKSEFYTFTIEDGVKEVF